MKMNAASRRLAGRVVLAGAFLLVFDTAALAQQRRSRNDEPLDVVFARVPDKARAKHNPLENDPEAAAAGKKLFGEHCAECHGETADGSKRGPSLRVRGVLQATPGEIFWIVTNGIVRHGMPAWSKLPEPQRWQIASFIHAFSGSTGESGGRAADTARAVENRVWLIRAGVAGENGERKR
jgi:mono/diheme cytochrome c family protein